MTLEELLKSEAPAVVKIIKTILYYDDDNQMWIVKDGRKVVYHGEHLNEAIEAIVKLYGL